MGMGWKMGIPIPCTPLDHTACNALSRGEWYSTQNAPEAVCWPSYARTDSWGSGGHSTHPSN